MPPDLEKGAGALLTAAAQVTWVMEQEVANCKAHLDTITAQLALAKDDLKHFMRAAEDSGVDPAPYVRRQEVIWVGISPLPIKCI